MRTSDLQPSQIGVGGNLGTYNLQMASEVGESGI